MTHPEDTYKLKQRVLYTMNMENFNTWDDIKIRGLFATCNAADDFEMIGLVGNMKDQLAEKFQKYLDVKGGFDEAILTATMSIGKTYFKNYSTNYISVDVYSNYYDIRISGEATYTKLSIGMGYRFIL